MTDTDTQLNRKVSEVLSSATYARTETESLLQNVKLVKNDLNAAKDDIKALRRGNVEKDIQIEELHQTKKYLNGRIDVLQDQLKQLWNECQKSGPLSICNVLPLKTSSVCQASDVNDDLGLDNNSYALPVVESSRFSHVDTSKSQEGKHLSTTCQNEELSYMLKKECFAENQTAAPDQSDRTFKTRQSNRPVDSGQGRSTAMETLEGSVDSTAKQSTCIDKAKEYFMSERVWIAEAEEELRSGLAEISTRHGRNNEYVSLVTFGAQTRCQYRFTNNYDLLKEMLASQKVGGPTPLFGGLHMAISALYTPEKRVLRLVNEVRVYPKIILITDGYPTELRLHSGADIPDPEQMDETTGVLLNVADALRTEDTELFCVPVGKPNMEFLNMLLSKECGRRMLQISDGHYFSRRLLLTSKLRWKLTFLRGPIVYIPEKGEDIIGRDVSHMQDILDTIQARSDLTLLRQELNPYEERQTDDRLLAVGSRVRRGPDWDLADEDGNGPGTVVGHHFYRDAMYVHWDNNNKILLHDYGRFDIYAVLPYDEPRMPLPGQPLDVGCAVMPGKHWKKDESIPENMKGVIIKIVENRRGLGKAVVRWENGRRGEYSYGDDRVFEIQICMPDSMTAYKTTDCQKMETNVDISATNSAT